MPRARLVHTRGVCWPCISTAGFAAHLALPPSVLSDKDPNRGEFLHVQLASEIQLVPIACRCGCSGYRGHTAGIMWPGESSRETVGTCAVLVVPVLPAKSW